MTRPVLHPQAAKSPGQRITACIIAIRINGGKARAFGQVAAAVDAMGQGRVAALQEGDDRGNGGQVATVMVCEKMDCRAACCRRERFHLGENRYKPVPRQQAQHQRQSQVFLHGLQAARAQESGQIGGGRVGRVELRHWRDDGQHAHDRMGFHGCRRSQTAL